MAGPIRSWRERKNKGVSFGQALDKARELKEKGELQGLNEQEAMAVVMSALVSPEDIAADPKFDWKGLFAFLEVILPYIFKLIGL